MQVWVQSIVYACLLLGVTLACYNSGGWHGRLSNNGCIVNTTIVRSSAIQTV